MSKRRDHTLRYCWRSCGRRNIAQHYRRVAGLFLNTIWVLAGPKAGDNAQMRALAAAVGPFETRNLQFRSTELLTNLLLRTTLLGLRPRQSDELRPPWPNLVITAGRRNEPVARWIKQRSGQSTKLEIGRASCRERV